MRVADGLVEAVVGALLEEEGKSVIGVEVVVVPELVVDGDQVFFLDLDAHLDAQIVVVRSRPRRWRDTPRRGPRLHEHRPLPEGGRQRIEAQRDVEGLARFTIFIAS